VELEVRLVELGLEEWNRELGLEVLLVVQKTRTLKGSQAAAPLHQAAAPLHQAAAPLHQAAAPLHQAAAPLDNNFNEL
jgi:hypothetical protein